MSDSLHDDGGLHQFKEMYAELEDGRTVKVAVGEDGHLEIVGFMEGTDPTPDINDSPSQPEPAPYPAPYPSVPVTVKQTLNPPNVKKAGSLSEATLNEIQKKIIQKKITQMAQNTVGPAQSIPPGSVVIPSSVVVDYSVYSSHLQGASKGVPYLNLLPQGGVGGSGDMQGPEEVATKIERDPVFQARLASVMNDNQFDRRLRGRTRGKLDMTRLYKAQTGSKSVFTQKMSRRNKKYNIALVVDQSGSMFGTGSPHQPGLISSSSRIAIAGDVAQFLAQHLDRIPGVELMIVGFSSGYKVHKEFGKNLDLDKVKHKVLSYGGDGTADDIGLSEAYSALKKQDKGQNIVLLLTDGESDYPVLTRYLVKRNTHLATTFAVGIQSTPTQAKKHIVVSNVATLKPAIIGLLEKEIRRG